MKLLSNPLIPVVLGLLLGVGAGLGLFWREAKALTVTLRQQQAAAAEAARPEKPWDFWTQEIEDLAAELKAKNTEIKVREQAVAAREERLAGNLIELEKMRQQVDALRKETTASMMEMDAEEARNLKAIAKTYGELTPKAAVGILQKMDESNAVKILHLMKSDAVSPILQEMGTSPDPEIVKRAAQLTDRLRLVKSPKAATP